MSKTFAEYAAERARGASADEVAAVVVFDAAYAVAGRESSRRQGDDEGAADPSSAL